MMLKLTRAAALAALVGFAAAPAIAADDPVVAVINGKEVRRSALVELQQSQPQLRQVPTDMIYDQLIDHLIDTQVVTSEARKQNLQDDPKVKAQLKEIESNLIASAYLQKRAQASVTEDQVKKRYEELLKTTAPREEVKARHILVESEDQAKAVIKEIKGGAKFEDVAKAKSKDTASGAQGGDLGYFGKGEMVPAFSDAAFAMKKGDVSETPIKTEFGWHVIKVEDKRNAEAPQYDQVKEQIRAGLEREAATTVIKDLRSKAKIQKFTLDGKPAPAAPAAAPKQ